MTVVAAPHPQTPVVSDDLGVARRTLEDVAERVDALLDGLPAPVDRSDAEHASAEAAKSTVRAVRARFMDRHVGAVYDELTDGRRARPGLALLAERTALRFPGLVPTIDRVTVEQSRLQAAKEGLDIDYGIFCGGLLADPVAGGHLVDTMLMPTETAMAALPAFVRTGAHERPSVRLERRDDVAHLTMCRPDCLNAEDEEQVADMEVAVDLALLDPTVRVGVLRGGPMTHPRYAGRRVFSSGVNLKALSAGRITLLGFLLRRELGYVRKLVSGVRDDQSAWPPSTKQKPWIAVVDTFAIGGGAQLLLAVDRVVAVRNAYLSLPAAQEGIVPGAANLRLGALAGARLARQLVLYGRKVWAREADGKLFFDEVVDPGGVDDAVAADAANLASSAVLVNRRMLNLAREPDDTFRTYMAEFAVQQALRLHSRDVLSKVDTFVHRVTSDGE